MITYEQKLGSSHDWALREGSMHFEYRSSVHRTLHKICRKLEELGIPYAVAGGMALFAHGYRRFTEVVDMIVTREGLTAIQEALTGRGYVPLFRGSKNLRDTEFGVRIEFIISGDFPGDGRPKPVSFPQPQEASIELNGIRYLKLPSLIELKLASGMTNELRMRDISDVLDLIKALRPPRELELSLDPYVRDKYLELWDKVDRAIGAEPE